MISKKQQKFIIENRDKYSPDKLAKELNLSQDELIEFLKTKVTKKTPKSFYAFMILIPVLFFVLIEITLRFADYGTDTRQWIDVSEKHQMINPEVAFRYFHNVKTVPTTIEDVFAKEKGKNNFRVFIMGGSSAAGYPYEPLGSFSRYIKRRLEITYPQTEIEVINIAMSAVNTYTILDLLPGVLEKNPDLILIYAGHNEYYGALGAGSLESLGNSREIVNLVLYLNKYKTVQMLRDFLKWAAGQIADKQETTGTLMARMAEKKQIEFEDEIFTKGIEQFNGNMKEIVKKVKDANVNLIIGNLASNLKDQKPFVSVKGKNNLSAEGIFNKAQRAFSERKYKKADSLFRIAKDLDALRFRAPEEINNHIDLIGKEFNVPVVKIDSFFSSESTGGIIGDNLMIDHLHPSLRGYQLMGKAFYEKMNTLGCLPKTETAVDFSKQDSLTRINVIYSKLDKAIADYRIKKLKNDWPFVKNNDQKLKIDFNPVSYEDSMAVKVVTKKLSWLQAHEQAAEKALKSDRLDKFLEHKNILIYQYPVVTGFYDKVILTLLQKKKFDLCFEYLEKRHFIKPDHFSAKWLGTISLHKKKISEAIKFLEESNSKKGNDAQVLYNLAGAYAMNKEYEKGKKTIEECLKLNPDYPSAKNLLRQLKNK